MWGRWTFICGGGLVEWGSYGSMKRRVQEMGLVEGFSYFCRSGPRKLGAIHGGWGLYLPF